MAETSIAQDSYGLNKSARLAAEYAAQKEADTPAPLDPEFPFEVLAFDASYFTAWPQYIEPPL